MNHSDADEVPGRISDPEGFADYLFDSVSGTLRERPEAGPWAAPPSRATKEELRAFLVQARDDFQALRRGLVESDARFDELHEWITEGNPLPDPWRKHYVQAETDEDAES